MSLPSDPKLSQDCGKIERFTTKRTHSHNDTQIVSHKRLPWQHANVI